jgi:hypothetical protein
MDRKKAFRDRMNDFYFIVEDAEGNREILAPDDEEDDGEPKE